jgi:hypothetical protein
MHGYAAAPARDGHLPVHGRRGVDAAAREAWRAVRGAVGGAPSRLPGGVRAPRRRRGRHAGDAFFVAFARASDALAAAAEAQRALDGGLITVRMGVHTGEPILSAEGYVGMDVHRAADRSRGSRQPGADFAGGTRPRGKRPAPRSWRASSQGPGGAGAGLPARASASSRRRVALSGTRASRDERVFRLACVTRLNGTSRRRRVSGGAVQAKQFKRLVVRAGNK